MGSVFCIMLVILQIVPSPFHFLWLVGVFSNFSGKNLPNIPSVFVLRGGFAA
jgi:hypothetical protein